MEGMRAQHGHTQPRRGHQVLADIYCQTGTRRKRLAHKTDSIKAISMNCLILSGLEKGMRGPLGLQVFYPVGNAYWDELWRQHAQEVLCP